MFQIVGQQRQEPFPQFHGGLMGQAAEHDVGHFRGLPPHGVHEDGVSVAVDGAPPRGHAVHQLPPVAQPDAHARRAHRLPHRERVQRRRIRVPQVFPVEGEKRRRGKRR